MTRNLFESGLRISIFCSLIGGLTHCASTSQNSSSSETALTEDPSRGIYCAYESTLGSSVRRKHCTTPEQREAELSEAQEQMSRPALGGAGRRGSGM